MGKKGKKAKNDDSDIPLPNAKGGRKGGKGGRGDDDDDELERNEPIPNNKKNKKGKKGGKGGKDHEDSEEEKEVEVEEESEKNKKNNRKNNKKGKGKKGRGDDDDSEEEEKVTKEKEEEEDDDDESKNPKKGGKNNNRKNNKKGKGGKKGGDEDDDNEEEDIGIPLPNAGKKNKFSTIDDDDNNDNEGEGDEKDEIPLPNNNKKNKQNKKGKKGGKGGKKEEEEEEEDIGIPLPNAGKKNKFDDDDEEEDTAIPLPNNKKGKKGKKGKKDHKQQNKKDDDDNDDKEEDLGIPLPNSKKNKFEDDEDDDDEEELEIPQPVSKKNKNKKKNRNNNKQIPEPPQVKEEEELPKEEEENEDQTPKEEENEIEEETPKEEENETPNEEEEEEDLPLISNKEKRKLKREAEEAKRREEEEERKAQIMAEEAEWGGAAPSAFSVSQPAKNLDDEAWKSSKDIVVEKFTISAGGKSLLIDADLKIQAGVRYGLVGPNGRGKSTLLKLIATRELHIPPAIDILYVEQEVFADDTPAYLSVLKADKRRTRVLELEKLLEECMEKASKNLPYTLPAGEEGTLEEQYQRIQEELNVIGIEKTEAKARRILAGLGFDKKMQDTATKDFSGGWRMRISLARALFIEPDLLLLDEPTNHLDLNAVLWLDEYLHRWKKTLLVVSHDQDFLSSVCTFIIHLYNHKLFYYQGDYHKFKKMEAQKREELMKEYEKQQKELKRLKQAGKSKVQAEKEAKNKKNKETKSKKGDPVGMEAAENQQMTLLEKPNEYVVKFTFPEVVEIRPPIIEVDEMTFRYSETSPYLFKNVSFGIDLTSRISIVGPNGSGKSTLLKIITGDLVPTIGESKRNSKLRIGKYSQHFVDQIPMDKTPVEYLMDQFKEQKYQDIRQLLGRYGLEGHAHTIPIKNLSGGQKSRVVFADICLRQPHILIFDEPTNNLDIESIDALGDAINAFEGGVVVVSHDARLLTETKCVVWIVGEEKVTQFRGSFEDYRRDLVDSMEFEEEEEYKSKTTVNKVEEVKKEAEKEQAALSALFSKKTKKKTNTTDKKKKEKKGDEK